MARLAALVPTPRMHLTRYHGVFAPPLDESIDEAQIDFVTRRKAASPDSNV